MRIYDLRLWLELLCGCGDYTVSVYEFCNYYTVAVITQSLLRLSIDFGLSRHANAALSNESQKATDSSSLYRFLGCFRVSLRQPTTNSTNTNLLVSTQIQQIIA